MKKFSKFFLVLFFGFLLASCNKTLLAVKSMEEIIKTETYKKAETDIRNEKNIIGNLIKLISDTAITESVLEGFKETYEFTPEKIVDNAFFRAAQLLSFEKEIRDSVDKKKKTTFQLLKDALERKTLKIKDRAVTADDRKEQTKEQKNIQIRQNDVLEFLKDWKTEIREEEEEIKIKMNIENLVTCLYEIQSS